MTKDKAGSSGSQGQLSSFPPYLQRVFPEGCSLKDLLHQFLAAVPHGRLVAERLITDSDPLEYSEGLLTHTYVHLSPYKPSPKPHLLFQQQSSQSEVIFVLTENH